MKKIILLFFLFSCGLLKAQTGIGTTTPDASAKLEVASTNKGFLPPRVALTATNAASPITNPANGLMVFNTVTAGTNPFQVVPGYYYWDATAQRWVSLSTTVGNVQNQAIFRSTSNTAALNPVSTWSSSFNNIASGDMSIATSTTFTLSNGFYKLEWALPYQPTGTYNDMLLQEFTSGAWGTFKNSETYARIANGGSGNWGGTTFAADVVDCSISSRTFRLYNADGAGRVLYAGATFIITKLNPSITTSTTADNLGNHIATNNIQLNGNYLSNDGTNKGIRIDNTGNVGIGTTTPATSLHIQNGNTFGNPGGTSSPSIYVYNSNNASNVANSTISVRTAGTGSGKPYYSLDVNGAFGYSMGINNPTDQMILNTSWDFNTSAANNALIINRYGTNRVIIPNSSGGYLSDWPSGWGGGLSTYDITCGAIYANGYVTRSDNRLKNTVSTIPNDFVSKYLQLRPVTYYWNQDQPRDPKLQFGLIAQEVEPLFPEMVNTATDEMQTKSVNYQALHALSLKVIQEQQKQIEDLQQKQAALEQRLLLLESKK